MHSGFQKLRELCGLNIRANFQTAGAQLWREHPELQEDIARIEQIWSERPNVDGFLCGDFSIADTFYAPVVARIQTYSLPVSESAQRYIQIMLKHPAIQEWMNEARDEVARVLYYEAYQED